MILLGIIQPGVRMICTETKKWIADDEDLIRFKCVFFLSGRKQKLRFGPQQVITYGSSPARLPTPHHRSPAEHEVESGPSSFVTWTIPLNVGYKTTNLIWIYTLHIIMDCQRRCAGSEINLHLGWHYFNCGSETICLFSGTFVPDQRMTAQ